MSQSFTPRRQLYPGYEGKGDPTEQDRIIHFMQYYHSTEGFNAAFLTRWAEATPDESVRGGLRVIQGRESMHARLLRERLKELGETEFREVPEERRQQEVPFYASTELTDYEKLSKIMTIFTDVDYFMEPMTSLIADIKHDLRSKELLAVIYVDEAETVKWFAATHKRLGGAQAGK